MKYSRLILILLLCFSSCVKKESKDYLIDLKIDMTSIVEVNDDFKYLLVVTFEGDCSSCILDFISWLKNWNKYGNEIRSVFLVKGEDTYTVEYYLDRFGVQLHENQLLVACDDNIFIKNKFLTDYWNVLLLDENFKILSSNDPFVSKQARSIYKSYSLLGDVIKNRK